MIMSLFRFLHCRQYSASTFMLLFLFIFTGTTRAQLVNRGNGLIYDADQDITWVQYTNTAGDVEYLLGELLTKQQALDFVDWFNTYIGGVWGATEWRLPVTPTAMDGTCSGSYNTGTGCRNSELGYLYYVQLGNSAGAGGFTNRGLFIDISNGYTYWTDWDITIPGAPDESMVFTFGTGMQTRASNDERYRVWLVHDGDIAPVTQCNDGEDNDGDGKIDLEDPGCPDPGSDNELSDRQCSDGIDNDGDGYIDFPADAGCSSAYDNSEKTSIYGSMGASVSLWNWCDVVYTSYYELPSLVCDFLTATSLRIDMDQDIHQDCPPHGCHFPEHAGSYNDSGYRSELYNQLPRLLINGMAGKVGEEQLALIGELFEDVPGGQYFDEGNRKKLITALKQSGELNAKLAAMLVDAMNAIELDVSVPEISPVKVGPGKISSANMQNICWMTFKDLTKGGELNLKINGNTDFAKPIRGLMPGWPFAMYDFSFSGDVDKAGYIDLNIYYGGLFFPGRQDGLQLFEWDGKTFKNITINVDVSRKIITGRTNRLMSYVIMSPAPQKRIKTSREYKDLRN